jgi:hypothetical protein
MAQLIQVTIVWRSVWTPAQKRRGLPQPPPIVDGSEKHLTHHLRRDSTPWRDRIVLPARRNGAFFRTRGLKQAAERSDLVGPKVATDAEVVDCAVTMAQPEHELWGSEIACNANDDAVGGSITLHLNPVPPSARPVPPIDTLGHDTFDRQQRQPIAREIDVGGLLYQLEAGMRGRGQEALEFASTRQKWLVHQAAISYIEHVEHDQDGRTLPNYSVHMCSSLGQTCLQGAEVGIAVVGGDDHFAVDQRAGRQRPAGLNELGEPRPEVATISAQKLHDAPGPMPQHSSKAVQLGLVPPHVAGRQLRFQLRQHRSGRPRDHGSGAYAVTVAPGGGELSATADPGQPSRTPGRTSATILLDLTSWYWSQNQDDGRKYVAMGGQPE